MKHRILFIIGCLFISASAWAFQPDENAYEEVSKAIALATGSKGRFNRSEALRIFQQYAAKGDPRAMNGLGLMYLRGHEITADSTKAIEWLTKAGEAGYVQAWQNLGLMYFYAHCGVKQNFEKAFHYFNTGVKAGGIGALYDAGYMLYKGLGCQQDYKKAMNYFIKGAGKEHAPCMYMLGLCYRNGYGTDMDEAEANYWLTEAEKHGYTLASEELEAEKPENSLEGTKVLTQNAISVPTTFARTRAVQKDMSLNGVYQGILVTYDWSGQHIISETPLQLSLQTEGNRVQGEWMTDTDTVWVNATIKDGILHFENTQMHSKDHYLPEEPILYQFTEAEIQAVASSLTGNIRMYSPQLMEPQRPMYLSLYKTRASGIEDTRKDNKYIKAYPNPFSDNLNLAFTLSENADVKVAIYDYSGRNVHMTALGTLQAGEQRFSMTPNLEQGVYIVKVFAGKETFQVIVVKEGGQK